MEFTHDLQARTTANSADEGRLKVDTGFKKKKRKILKKCLSKY